MSRGLRSALIRYGLAVLVFVVIVATAALLQHFSLKINFALPVVAGLVIATWYGGRGSGIFLAVLLQVVIVFSNGIAVDSNVVLTAIGHVSVFGLLLLVVLLVAGRKAAQENLEQRVQERTEQLNAANKELEAFSYSASHDLRSPLRHISGFSRILLEDYGDKLDDEGKGYLNEIESSVGGMTKLIDDVLELATVARAEIRRETVNLSELALDIVEDLRKMEPTRNTEIQIADGIKATGDERLLRIVLCNLLGNAWKFTSKVEHARIDFGQELEKGSCVYFVRDNGAGFDMAFGGKLFEDRKSVV